jgi:hypothetical protein
LGQFQEVQGKKENWAWMRNGSKIFESKNFSNFQSSFEFKQRRFKPDEAFGIFSKMEILEFVSNIWNLNHGL